MSRDKLITIRIEESKRNAFRKWAKKNKIDGATFLYRVIEQCINNQLGADLINKNTGRNEGIADIQASIQQLYKQFEEKNIEQDSKITNLQSQIDDLKSQLSTQNFSLKSTQKVSKRVYNSQDNLLSDLQLAEILGVARATVNRWRTLQRKPSKQYQNIFDQYEVIKDKWRKI